MGLSTPTYFLVAHKDKSDCLEDQNDELKFPPLYKPETNVSQRIKALRKFAVSQRYFLGPRGTVYRHAPYQSLPNDSSDLIKDLPNLLNQEENTLKIKRDILCIWGEIGSQSEAELMIEYLQNIAKSITSASTDKKQQNSLDQLEKTLDTGMDTLMQIGGMNTVKTLANLAANVDLPIYLRHSALIYLEELAAGGWIDFTDHPAPPPRKYTKAEEIPDQEMREVWVILNDIIAQEKDIDIKWKATASIAYLERAMKPPTKIKLIDFAYARALLNSDPKAHVIIELTTNYGDRQEHQQLEARATGNGPIDASCNAINKILKESLGINLTAFQVVFKKVDAQNTGHQAEAKAVVAIGVDGQKFEKDAKDTDTVKATVLAYIEAINEALANI